MNARHIRTAILKRGAAPDLLQGSLGLLNPLQPICLRIVARQLVLELHKWQYWARNAKPNNATRLCHDATYISKASKYQWFT